MSTTQAWRPYVYPSGEWLLCDGSLVSAPAMEQSPAGRRVRVAGDKKSFHWGDVDRVVTKAIEDMAALRGTTVWCNVTDIPKQGDTELHFLKDQSWKGTTVWWSFKHPDYPIEAVINLHVTLKYGSRVEVGATMETTRLNPQWAIRGGTSRWTGTDWNNLTPNNSVMSRVQELMRDHPPAFMKGMNGFFGDHEYDGARRAVKEFLACLDKFDNLLSVQIPDIDGNLVGWIDLPLHNTNVTGELVTELRDFLDSASTIGDVVKAYNEFRSAMIRLGFTLPETDEDDLLNALQMDSKSAYVAVGQPYDAHGNLDPDEPIRDHLHTIYLHLSTGTIMVSCDKTDTRDMAAQAWEEACTVASLTGQTDDLLKFANDYAKNGADAGVRKFVNARRMALA